jgi:pilus assembly protein CpaF
LKSDPAGTPAQRGAITERHAWHLKQVIHAAQAIGAKVLGIEDPLEVNIERTPEREQRFQTAVQQLARLGVKQTGDLTPEQFVEWVGAELFGYGPLDRFLARSEISEVMVNGPYIIFIEREGKIVETGHKFYDDAHVERIIRRIVRPLGRSIGPDNPLVDARLPDGSRVNAAVAPCTLDGPSVTIRKFQTNRLALSDLVRLGALSEDMATFLTALVEARQNIIVSGGTGSGKTTLINALSEFIPEGERVVTIEDAAELKLVQRNVVRLESKKPTLDHPVAVTIRDCLVNALRMRPERILIGECRSAEALDMLQAMNTGHDGSMTTVHANTPRDTISRLETLTLMGGLELPVMVIRKQIASAVQFIVQASRMRDGSRRVTHITEVQNMEGETVVLSDIFLFKEEPGRDGKIEGRHRPTGNRPKCMADLTQHGRTFPKEFFTASDPPPMVERSSRLSR